MYEAIIYDWQDVQSDHPDSSLGCYESMAEALQAIAEYIQWGKEEIPAMMIYRVQVLKDGY